MASTSPLRTAPGAHLARFLAAAGHQSAALHVAVDAGLVDDDLLVEAFETGADVLELAGIVDPGEAVVP